MAPAMTPEEWAKVKKVVAAALDVPAAERRSFVEKVCAQDRVAFQEVLSLLNFEVDVSTQSDSRPTAGAPAMSLADGGTDFTPGTILAGRYRIVSPLGRG